MKINNIMMGKMVVAFACLLLLSACGGSNSDATQLASWDNMYYYDVELPQ
jgi:hypothetical protein